VSVSTFRVVSEIAYIALGSNLGDRRAYLDRARAAIAAIPHTRVLGRTEVEETEPLGGLAQPPYLNQMIAVETSLDPSALLEHLQQIEAASGRVRTNRWDSRTLDLDIVTYGDSVMSTPALVLPHPGLADREFWQRELADLKAAIGETVDE
jgi:2-amino-4-hydroxy-6-hydroxymethyldihydropteridine diphosphokinase